MEIKVCKISEDAKIPSFKREGDAGMDLCSIEDFTLNPMSFGVVGTGLKFEIPDGYEIQIRPRSGLAAKYGISVLNTPGTIDSGYRGEVKVILFNFSPNQFKIEKGMRICQMVVSKLDKFNLIETDTINEISERKDGRFGSTGLK